MIDERLRLIFNACNPNQPATAENYSDCREARGGDALTDQIIRQLRMADDSQQLRFLFTGHIGSGKSSELVHLVEKLRNETTFPIYVDFKEYLDEQDTRLEDVFVALAIELSEKFKARFNHQLEDALLRSWYETLRGFANGSQITEAEIGLPEDVGKLKAEFKQNPTVRKQLHSAIKAGNISLLTEFNLLLDKANLFLAQNTAFERLVLIADGLEKIEQFDGRNRGLESQRQLFIESQAQLTGIAAHVLFTIPLFLYRSSEDAPKLAQYYGNESFVLPMVKIHKRGNFDENYPLGHVALRAILQKRFGRIRVEGEAFEPDALEHLIRYSGGNIRNLLRFVQQAITYTDSLPIKLSAARKSVGKAVDMFAASIDEQRGHYQKLAQLELSPNQQIVTGDDAYSTLLENTTIFEYVNGDESGAEEGDYQRWYAVNPVVRRLPKFTQAIEELKQAKVSQT